MSKEQGGFTDNAALAAAITAFDLDHLRQDPYLDSLCAVVARQCDAPIGLVSLVDQTEQHFLGRSGTPLTHTPRDTSFCAIAMLEPELTVVTDATKDMRFADFELVTGPPHIRFYAGAPLLTEEGVPLGMLCVIDVEPRRDLSADRRFLLSTMAKAVMDHLSLRRASRDMRVARNSEARALDESQQRFSLLVDALPQIAWSSTPDGHSDYFNARWHEFTGMSAEESYGLGWTRALHPDDVERTRATWERSRRIGEPFDIEYRLRDVRGAYRWVMVRGLAMRGNDGVILHWFGTCTDIHDNKLAMEEREIISQELSHRIKNIFAVISGLVGLSARQRPEFAHGARDLRDRIMALGRAHDFVRPHSQRSRPIASRQGSLHGLLSALFAPYETSPGERIAISGNDVSIDDRSATPLALLFHEVATNAAKYGALSTPDGGVILTITQPDDKQIEMLWQESGGPSLVTPPEAGFGTQLLDLSVRRQLGGAFDQAFETDGLRMTIRIPLTAFSR